MRSSRSLGKAATPAWGDLESARLLTCVVTSELLEGRAVGAVTATPFALHRPARCAYVSGPIRVLELRAAGDGSYLHSSGFVVGTGPMGLALLAGSLIGNATGNALRRQRAHHDAQLAFRHQLDAIVYVTDVGFVLHNYEGVFSWHHDAIDAMQVVGPGVALMQGQAIDRRVTWQLLSPWAELMFVTWALERHPDHAQLLDGSWFREGWLAYARSRGRDPRLVSTRIGHRHAP